MIDGDWSILTGSDLYRKTVGVVRLGRIGRSLVQRLGGFEARIFIAAPTPAADYAARTRVEYVDLDTLLTESDYVSLHAPLTPRTRFLIDDDAPARMEPGTIL